MTNLRNLIGLFLVSLLFFTACKKDSITPTTTQSIQNATTDNNTEPNAISPATQTRAMAAATLASARNNGNNEDCGCYDLFEGIDIDASHEEVEAAVDSLLATLTEEEIIRLFEPVCTDDGEIYESACIADCEGITNYHICTEEELADYFFGDFDCADLENLTFPTDIELPDGTTITVNNEEELFDLLETWYEALDEDWETDYDDDFDDCFTVIFPIQIQFPDGTVISYDNEEDLFSSLDTWYGANPDTKTDPIPVYPFEVLLEDSTQLTINSELEEEALWEACYGDIDFDICFDVNYPITLVYSTGDTLVVNNDEELEAADDKYDDLNLDIEITVVFPISITLTDGTVEIIEDEDGLEAALEKCYDESDFSDGMGRLAQQSKKSLLSSQNVIKGAALSGATTR